MHIKSIKSSDFNFTINKPMVVFYPKEYRDNRYLDGIFAGYKKLSLCFKLFATLFGKDVFFDKNMFCNENIGDIKLEFVGDDVKTRKRVVDNDGNNTPFGYKTFDVNKKVFYLNPYDMARYTGEFGHEFYKAQSMEFSSYCTEMRLMTHIDQLVIDIKCLGKEYDGDLVWNAYKDSGCHTFYLFATSYEQAKQFETKSTQLIAV